MKNFRFNHFLNTRYYKIYFYHLKQPIVQMIMKIIPGIPRMKYITNLPDLDRELDYVDSQFKISDDSGRIALNNFCYKIEGSVVPQDPLSREYYEFQMKLYSLISGRSSYQIINEESVFDQEKIKETPFPYYTHSAGTVGDQLLMIGFIIKNTNLPADSNIVEFGPGWGNLTLALAQMGHKLTCVEIESRFIELIKFRTQGISKQIVFFQQDMLDFTKSSEKKFDAAIFYESFHHCQDPVTMIKNLSNIITNNGILCFASEPIVCGPSGFIPYPWGIRLDGMSVWSIRRFGWMELGFEINFFLDLLTQNGFTTEKISSDVCPLTNLIIARKVE
jgi:SAM-dependent methyltransferase